MSVSMLRAKAAWELASDSAEAIMFSHGAWKMLKISTWIPD